MRIGIGSVADSGSPSVKDRSGCFAPLYYSELCKSPAGQRSSPYAPSGGGNSATHFSLLGTRTFLSEHFRMARILDVASRWWMLTTFWAKEYQSRFKKSQIYGRSISSLISTFSILCLTLYYGTGLILSSTFPAVTQMLCQHHLYNSNLPSRVRNADTRPPK
jgi:hypothetical protein